MEEPKKLYTVEFIALCFVYFFAFCNMSVFYSFFSYLGRIGIPEEWRGFLVGLEPMSAFALKLAIIPMLHMGNAVKAILISLLMLIVALCSYTWAVTIPSLIVLRIFHGAAFVLLVSAVTALAVHFIPRERSAQGFGILSIAVLVPYAVVPFVTEILLPYVRNETGIYAGVALLAVPGIAVLLVLRKRVGALLEGADTSFMKRPSLDELRWNLRHKGVVLILAVSLLFYLSHSTVFFFMKSYLKMVGAGNAGAFFATSTLVMIAVRAMGGPLMDKANKVRTITLFAFFLICWFALFAHVRSPLAFILLAACYGLCVGVVMPMLGSAIFQASPVQLRGLNTNLGLFMMDTGYFLSPFAGGLLLARGWPLEVLFYICSGLLALAVCPLVALGRVGIQAPDETSPHVNETAIKKTSEPQRLEGREEKCI